MSLAPTWSKHATERWAYRFGRCDPDEEWRRARRISPKRLARLNHHSGCSARHAPGRTYWLSPGGVVFVVAAGAIVVTVYRIGG